ncbi:hypothetical protein CK203_072883 [Vitis vinifera]|uniref:Integrase zinc-binding domain-containing protein n=1 Tax=Vitis vinifera TaxID=29760 RepID=A0A438DMF0_VITVI|nr:hypothetical protein CK203_072883 [Vitis vinifera]
MEQTTLALKSVTQKLRSYFQAHQGEYKANDERMARYLVRYILVELHEGVCDNHASGRTLAHRTHSLGYYWPTMRQDAENYVKRCDRCQRYTLIPRMPSKVLNPVTSP